MEESLNYIVGFIVWIVLGVALGVIMPRLYRAAGTEQIMAIVFGICGSFVGGMLGESANVFHDPNPLRVAGLIGAVAGAIFFTWLYQFIAHRVV